MTTNAAPDTRPQWTPDGRRILFTSYRDGYPVIYSRSADGTGSDERVLVRANNLVDLRGSAWSKDGRQLLFVEIATSATPSILQCAIGQVALDRPSDVKLLLKNEFCNDRPALSPDGRWMAYDSSESGRSEVYVVRYPELDNRQQVSTSSGRNPLWSRDGRELYFGSPNGQQMIVVPVRAGTTFEAARPQVLFELSTVPMTGGGVRPFDLTPDGQFIVIRDPEAGRGNQASGMVLVQNWTEELKRLVPAK